MEVKVVRYKPKDREVWNHFVRNSKNGTFLFNREYMEYHSDRFEDMSLLFYIDGKLAGLFPANLKDNALSSHDGLTYGGVISSSDMKESWMLEIFKSLKNYLRENRVNKIIYKAIPYIYHKMPAEEDLYALFINEAKLLKRDLSSTIFLPNKSSFNSGRRWRIKKAKENTLNIKIEEDYESFIKIVADALSTKYGIKPVHTAVEIKLLADMFPDNIQLFTVRQDGDILAGAIIYITETIVHVQYIASTEEGKKLSALDLLLDYLINEYYKDKAYFDFGISTEKDGRYLNLGLINQKEELGGRSVVYDTYELSI